jgi:ribonuclease-3
LVLNFLKQLLEKLTSGSKSKSDNKLVNTPGEIVSPEETRIIEKFQNQFGLQFSDHFLLSTALKHRSYLNLTNEARIFSNERLEFLGDAVLDLVVTHFLYSKFPNKTEGHLSKVKSVLVSKPVLADVAVEIILGDFVLMNRGEEKTGGRQRKSILADAFEAIIGAIYLDMGLEEASKFIHKYLLSGYKSILRKSLYRNYKSILLEYAQSNGQGLPEYRVMKELGPDHAKEFVIAVFIGREKLGEGVGKSKKIAEQEAAKQAVERLEIEEKY